VIWKREYFEERNEDVYEAEDVGRSMWMRVRV
jgi:hypothetical protein